MMAKADTYWRRTRRLTFFLLACWLCLTFGVTWFAREINHVLFLGFPLGFYMAAQGSLVIFLLIIWWYNRQMRKIDAEFGMDET
jgi:putative solute:sodium symporter small subunit